MRNGSRDRVVLIIFPQEIGRRKCREESDLSHVVAFKSRVFNFSVLIAKLQQKCANVMQVYREKLQRRSEQSRLHRANPRRGGRRKLFTESFIYRRQIDSLSDQSVRPARKPLRLPTPFLLDYFSSSAAGPASQRATRPVSSSLLGGINNFYRPSGRRNGKRRWAFNLLRV